MATHSRILAWRIPWREETGRLQSMGLQRVGHDWVTFTHFTTSFSERWAANTINVYCSLFQISLLFQDIFLNWFSPKVFPPLLHFLFVILLLLPQVWSAALISQKEFQFPFMVFGFICIPWVYWLATTFKSYTQKFTCKIHMEMSLRKFREILWTIISEL